MAQVRSLNPFALLGEDGDDAPAPSPPKPSAAVATQAQKPIVGARQQPQKKAKNQADKREINADAPVPGELKEDRAASFGGRGGRGRGGRGRGAGNPRSNAGTYLGGDRPRRENGGGRAFDRQSQTGHKDSEKAENQGWGAEEGKQELEAEVLGEADAQADGAATPAPADGAATPARRVEEEEEDNSQTYEEYLAAQTERKLNIALPAPREVEETEAPKGKQVVKKTEQEEEEFLAAKTKESKAPKEKKTKTFLEVDFRHAAPGRRDGEERGGRGGRGGGRGRGEGRGRGGRGGRGGARGGRGGNNGAISASSGPAVNLDDDAAFPTL